MSLPGHVAEAVRRALERRGLGRRIENVTPVGGGCINHGARVETDAGRTLFLKWNDGAPPAMFAAEADGLSALARAGVLRVPAPLAWSDDDEGQDHQGPSWLLMEHVAGGSHSRQAEEDLGKGLARLHAHRPAGLPDSFGWRLDNWIGSLPQANTPTEAWGDYWRDLRIAPQLDLARRGGRLASDAFDRLLEVIPEALADVTRPELLHGDLWGGNWFASAQGEPVLIDPAVYLGHGEVDLAMSELFGGFGSTFYHAYRAEAGASAAYAEYRRDLYQLYYLLVHVNLFGGAYEAGSLAAARRVLAALGR